MTPEISKKIKLFSENSECTSVEMNAARKEYWGRVFSLVANNSESLDPVREVFVIKERVEANYWNMVAESFSACGN